ncbi:MAG: SDR family oxidoreductase [Bacteroidia bacterium]|nr:SDR family oxidoreductase [Bacteroidia bacterium]
MEINRTFIDKGYWAVILGGSSGIGLASAKKLAQEGMHLCILHRDRKKDLPQIEAHYDSFRQFGVKVLNFNLDATRSENIEMVLKELKNEMGENEGVRLLLHSIAKGNLKPMTDAQGTKENSLNEKAGVEQTPLSQAFKDLQSILQDEGADIDRPVLTRQDFELTIEAMALSIYEWVQFIHNASLFAADARVIGLTSAGNTKAWRDYAAVSAAKSALEAICRSISLEFARFGIRCNVVQPGITDTPSLRMIPSSDILKLNAAVRNPFQRLTLPADVANALYLLCTDEAAWINGAVIPVDGGEKNA